MRGSGGIGSAETLRSGRVGDVDGETALCARERNAWVRSSLIRAKGTRVTRSDIG
jgi:hypothetical protein